MEEEERDVRLMTSCYCKWFSSHPFYIQVYVNQMTAEERSKMIKLTEKHCRQMMNLIYKKKMEYFKSGGDDWKEVTTDRSAQKVFYRGMLNKMMPDEIKFPFTIPEPRCLKEVTREILQRRNHHSTTKKWSTRTIVTSSNRYFNTCLLVIVS